MFGSVGQAIRCYWYRQGANDADDDQQADIGSPPSADLNATALKGSDAFEDNKQTECGKENDLM
jgi:hypothetical protein